MTTCPDCGGDGVISAKVDHLTEPCGNEMHAPPAWHTEECWDYAAKTSRVSGVHHCIAACGKLRAGTITTAQYWAEVRK